MPIDENSTGIRLNKYIAESGVCSRREADQLITEGRVMIDGRVGTLGDRVLPGMRVAVRGKLINPVSDKVYIALNKPVGIVCTADPREPYNVVSYIGHEKRIFPIGRLDKDSSGLLLLTNDGEVVNKVLRAAEAHEKEYLVTVNKPVTEDFLQKMRSGVPILDTVTMPCRAEKIGDRQIRLVLVQGLNRQIRRMCEALNYRVVTLHRVRIMHIKIGNLQPGHWRYLTEDEVNKLYQTKERRPGGFDKRRFES